MLDLAVFYRDFEAKRRAQAVDGSALQLGFDSEWIDREATVDGGDDAVDHQFAGIADSHFDGVRGVAAEREMGCDPDTASRRSTSFVVDAFCNEFQQSRETPGVEDRAAVIRLLELTVLAIQVQTELQCVLA